MSINNKFLGIALVASIVTIRAPFKLSEQDIFALTNGMPSYKTIQILPWTESIDVQQGRRLMELMNYPEGNENIVCTNWMCPTSIVVNAQCYGISTNVLREEVIDFRVVDSNSTVIGSGDILIKDNGKDARLSAFVSKAATSMRLEDFVRRVVAIPLDPMTNSLYLASVQGNRKFRNILAYKNIHMDFFNDFKEIQIAPIYILTAILNAGLPEEERIDLTTVDQEKLEKCLR